MALGSQLAFSGSMGLKCDSSDVKTPCSSNSWQIGGQALYLQPTTSLSQSTIAITDAHDKMPNYRESWDWGFRFEAAYQYHQASDLNINWSHLDSSSQKSIAGPFVVNNVGGHPQLEWLLSLRVN